MPNPIDIDTDEAVVLLGKGLVNRYSHYSADLEDLGMTFTPARETQPVLKTTLLNQCVAVYIYAPEKATTIALHVSPSHAAAEKYSSTAYAHVIEAALSAGTKISVIVGGHTRNFNEAIFRGQMKGVGLIIEELIVGADTPSRLYQVQFDIEGKAMQVISTDGQDHRSERLALSILQSDAIPSTEQDIIDKNKANIDKADPALKDYIYSHREDVIRLAEHYEANYETKAIDAVKMFLSDSPKTLQTEISGLPPPPTSAVTPK